MARHDDLMRRLTARDRLALQVRDLDPHAFGQMVAKAGAEDQPHLWRARYR